MRFTYNKEMVLVLRDAIDSNPDSDCSALEVALDSGSFPDVKTARDAILVLRLLERVKGPSFREGETAWESLIRNYDFHIPA